MRRTSLWLSLAAGLFLALLTAWQLRALAQPAGVVEGTVVDADGPVAGAVVRQQTTPNSTHSATDGSFHLAGLPEGITVTVTAWAEGYWPSGVALVPSQSGVTLTLLHHPAGDNVDYPWLTSMPEPDKPIGCGHCMVAYPQWVDNAHAGSATNLRFLSLYNGTDVSGTLHLGGGYKDDFPGTAGNCATCHAPGEAAHQPFTADMNALTDVEAEGVFCDFCHKVSDIYLNPATGLPYPNMPGVQSMQLNRPPTDTHMFYGPFDDVTRRVSYLELEKESEFCAPCHQFSFWGTPIYESFDEWLQSPYPDQGIECQTCHMAPTGVDYFVFPEKGGLIRDPDTIASHLQPGASDVELLQNTVSMTLSVEQVAGHVRATVVITNSGAGHHVPTDFPGRHLILTVSATDGQGRPLPFLSGPTVPDWGGAPAGAPGKAFAKVLQDAVTGESPVVSYWKQAFIVSDNRIPALGSATSVYTFTAPSLLQRRHFDGAPSLPQRRHSDGAPSHLVRSEARTSASARSAGVPLQRRHSDGAPVEGGQATVSAELRFRRVFQAVADTRGWDKPDIVMAKAQATLATHPQRNVYLPFVLRTPLF